MLLVLVQTFFGLTFVGLGTYLAFIYLESLADGPAMLAILYASLLIVSGIVLLLKAGFSEVMVVKKIKMPKWGEYSEEETGIK